MGLIFTYLEAKQIFKDRIYALNKFIYQDINLVGNLFSQVLMSKLGVINDYQFELDYIKEITKKRILDED
jgi:hypothetical protein